MRNIGYGLARCGRLLGMLIFGMLLSLSACSEDAGSGEVMSQDDELKGYDATETGLVPLYPDGFDCSPLTSLYASWVDVDGTEREEEHTGVDGGLAGETIYAPAPGEVVRVWVSNWGWGDEGSLLIQHSREALNLGEDHAPHYYSEFDHLNYNDIKSLKPGQPIERGQKLGNVWYPGGEKRYLPEVHWEVWEVPESSKTKWKWNRYRRLQWRNRSAKLIDPLYMLSRQIPPNEAGEVAIQPYVNGEDYSNFSGFTYILPCGRVD